MERRWGGDGEEMGRRWGRDGEEMGRRWGGDGEEMDRGYMCAWEAWRTAGGEVHAVLHMVPACCAHGVCACCAHGVRMRCTCLRHIARPAIRAVDAWRGRAMATERAATVERGEARAYEQQRSGPCASKLGDPHRAAGGDEEEAQHLRCMGGAWGRSLARRRAAAWLQPGCSLGAAWVQHGVRGVEEAARHGRHGAAQ